MVKFVPLMWWTILSGVFILSLIIGGSLFATYNGNSNILLSDPELNNLSSGITDSLTTTTANTATESGAFSNSSITTTGVTPFISATGGIWKTITIGPNLIWNTLVTFVFTKIFGDAASLVIFGVVSSLLMLAIISSVIYLVARGEGG